MVKWRPTLPRGRAALVAARTQRGATTRVAPAAPWRVGEAMCPRLTAYRALMRTLPPLV